MAWDDSFLSIVGPHATVETIQAFSLLESEHVHEAPVFVPETNELLYSDTSVVGWLWAMNIDTHEAREKPAYDYVHALYLRNEQLTAACIGP